VTMATLYLDRKGLELRIDGAALALYESGSRVRTVPLSLLDRLVFRADTALTSSALGALADSGCAAIVLSGRQGNRLAMIYGRPHNDAALRMAQYAETGNFKWRLAWARRFIGAKIVRQQRFLRRALDMRADQRKPLSDALGTLELMRSRVEEESMNLDSLRGIEGAAQAAYFRAFTALFAEALHFHGRNRCPPRDPVNACLSLGYTLAHFEGVRLAHAAGLDPFLGFFHEIAFGRESLACDLIEPIRPLVDAWVWEMFRSRTLRPEHFTVDKGACVIEKTGRARFYENYELFLKSVSNRLRGYCRLLARELRAGAPELPVCDEEEDL
jgi:CRISPR-associated protein Cas1